MVTSKMAAYMIEAAKNGHVNSLKEWMSFYKSNINYQDEEGLTAVMWSCRNGHERALELILSSKETCDIEIRDNHKNTALLWAVKKSHTKCLQQLLAYGADPNVVDGDQVRYCCSVLVLRHARTINHCH